MARANVRRASARRSGPSVAMGFVTGLISGWAARGIDPASYLERCDVDLRQLTDPGARISLSSYAALYNVIAREFDDEALGLFPQPMRSGSFEFLTRSMLGSADLEEALHRAARFLRLVRPEMQLSVLRDGRHARLEISETTICWPDRNDPRRVFAFEWLLRLIHSLSCWLTDRSIALDSVSFPYAPPQHAGDYALIYTACSLFTGDVLTVTISADVLDAPIRRDESELASFLDGAPGRISMLYRRDRETFRRVRDLIALDLSEKPSLVELARRLHMSKRTLQRRLKEEGHSVRSIRDDIRRQLAFTKLARTVEPIRQISDGLGYSDPTAFYRAFRAWSSWGPRQYRKTIGEERAATTVERARSRARKRS